MAHQRWRVIVLVLVGLAGCSAPSASPAVPEGGAGGQGGDTSSVDAGPDISSGAAACGCAVGESELVLQVSWECYCAEFGCAERQPMCGTNRKSYSDCGLVTDTVYTQGGPSIRVYDSSGALVGRFDSLDNANFECPSDPTVQAGQIRAGRFPADNCAAMDIDGGTGCSLPDAG